MLLSYKLFENAAFRLIYKVLILDKLIKTQILSAGKYIDYIKIEG